MNVIESPLLEIRMNGVRHLGPDPIHSAERIRARPKVSNLSEEFHRVAFLLQQVRLIRRTSQVDFRNCHFIFLTLTCGRHERSFELDRCSSRYLLQHRKRFRMLYYTLNIPQRRAVVYLDKGHVSRAADSPDPAQDNDVRTDGNGIVNQDSRNLCT